MIVFIALSILHAIFFLWLTFHWSRIDQPVYSVGKENATFTIIVPIRNEAENITNLLTDLSKQTYPSQKFEVIVVDDHSEDNGPAIANRFFEQSEIEGRTVSLDDDFGKKAAITLGIKHSQGRYIITTDADCRIKSGWINAYNTEYSYKNRKMILGPVRMEGDSMFDRMQQYEFAGLIGLGACSLHAGFPTMCNGANLSYEKEVFLAVDGFEGNKHIPSGDDEFLLQKVHRQFPDQISFLRSSDAIVGTESKKSFKELINQRIRWVSKWKYHKSAFMKAMAIFFFLNYVILIAAFILSFKPVECLAIWSLVFLMRWLFVYLYNRSIIRFLGLKPLIFASLLGEIFYPLFVTFLGIASIFGKYSWKGRKYQ